MKYLCLAYGDENDWKQLSKDEQEALLKQDEVLRQRGDLVAAVDRAATTVKAWDGVPQTTDGGFAESRVPLAGFAIIDAPDLERAIELVNASRYGNASVIFTESGGAARAYRYGVQAGMIGVNVGVAAPIAWFPFSGWKDSIDGDLHANGRDAAEFFTRKKVITSRWAA